MSEYVTKDSGERENYESGMRRDTQDGKPRYSLIDKVFLKRWAELMTRGADKYGIDNWRLANSPEEWARFRDSGERHLQQWLAGDTEEDHAAAVAFNMAAADYVERKLKRGGWTLAWVDEQPKWTEPTLWKSLRETWPELSEGMSFQVKFETPTQRLFFPEATVRYDVLGSEEDLHTPDECCGGGCDICE